MNQPTGRARCKNEAIIMGRAGRGIVLVNVDKKLGMDHGKIPECLYSRLATESVRPRVKRSHVMASPDHGHPAAPEKPRQFFMLTSVPLPRMFVEVTKSSLERI